MIRLRVRENWDRLTDEQVAGFLSDDAEGLNHPSRKRVVELLAEWRSVLDVGCGPGIAFEMIARAYPRMEYLGVDITDKFIAYCQRRFPEHRACFRKLSVFELDRLGRSFDVVMCRAVLEHLSDYRRAVRQMYAKADRRMLIVFYLPPRPLSRGRYKIDMRYEAPFFYTHVYDLGRFVDFLLNDLRPAPTEVRIHPRQGPSGQNTKWRQFEYVIYEVAKPWE